MILFNIIKNHRLFHIRSCWYLWPFICITKLISPPHEAYVLIVDSFTISPCLNLCVLIPILKIRKGNIFSSFVRVFFWYYWIFPLTHFFSSKRRLMSIMLGDKFLYKSWPTSVFKEIMSIFWRVIFDQILSNNLQFDIELIELEILIIFPNYII